MHIYKAVKVTFMKHSLQVNPNPNFGTHVLNYSD